MLSYDGRDFAELCEDAACVEVGVCFAVHEGQVREEPMGEGGGVWALGYPLPSKERTKDKSLYRRGPF